MANLQGTANADTLTGTAAADSLTGLAGADSLTGLGGADTLEGGAESDLVSYTGSTAAALAESRQERRAEGGGREGPRVGLPSRPAPSTGRERKRPDSRRRDCRRSGHAGRGVRYRRHEVNDGHQEVADVPVQCESHLGIAAA